MIDLTTEGWILFGFIFGAFTMAALLIIIVLIAAAILALVSKIRDRSRPVEARGLRYDSNFVALLKYIVRWLTRKCPRSEYRMLNRAIARSGGALCRTYLRAALAESKEIQMMAQINMDMIEQSNRYTHPMAIHPMKSPLMERMSWANARIYLIRRALGAEANSFIY